MREDRKMAFTTMRGQSDPQPDYSVTNDAIIASVHNSGKSGWVRVTISAENEPMFMALVRKTGLRSLLNYYGIIL